MENQQTQKINPIQNPNQPTFEQELAKLNTEITSLASLLGVTKQECLALLTHRELMIQTRELRMMHEHLDDRLAIRKKKSKPKAH